MSIKILLADDSITIQKVVGIIFGGDDYALTVVDNGKAAVDKAREINPDVLLIDALMPGMSGYEVCEAVRLIPELASKPILLLTGSFEPFDEDKAKTCGADDFLAKPFESQQITTKVKELFELGSSRSGVPSSPSTPAAAAVKEIEFETPSAPETAPAGNDIWGAFTEPEATSASLDDTSFELGAPEPEAEKPAEDSTGSQWIPVAEETFEFQEETETAPAVTQEVTAAPAEDLGAFEMELTPVQEPVAVIAPAVELEQIPAPAMAEEAPAVAAAPAAAVPVTTIPAQMSEEQLRAAILGASREVIERIVWEVVPDLAEVMIKEAIRKIKEGA